MEYRVKVYGREITSSAHSLTDDEVDTIYEYMDEMEIAIAGLLGGLNSDDEDEESEE